MVGDIVVAGLVTGTHLIEDIKVTVPHKVAVRIPAEAALRSKDLWRALASGRIFKLDGGSGLQAAPAPSQASQTARVSQLEAANVQLQEENKRLLRELDAARARSDGLQQMLAGLQGQLQGIQGVLGHLKDLPNTLKNMNLSGASRPREMVVEDLPPEVVGGDAPKFIPTSIKPETATTKIQVQAETTDGSGVSAAASRLKSLRKNKS